MLTLRQVAPLRDTLDAQSRPFGAGVVDDGAGAGALALRWD